VKYLVRLTYADGGLRNALVDTGDDFVTKADAGRTHSALTRALEVMQRPSSVRSVEVLPIHTELRSDHNEEVPTDGSPDG